MYALVLCLPIYSPQVIVAMVIWTRSLRNVERRHNERQFELTSRVCTKKKETIGHTVEIVVPLENRFGVIADEWVMAKRV